MKNTQLIWTRDSCSQIQIQLIQRWPSCSQHCISSSQRSIKRLLLFHHDFTGCSILHFDDVQSLTQSLCWQSVKSIGVRNLALVNRDVFYSRGVTSCIISPPIIIIISFPSFLLGYIIWYIEMHHVTLRLSSVCCGFGICEVRCSQRQTFENVFLIK